MSESAVREYPLTVEYCGVCGVPPEYCEYGPEVDKCREWLKENRPDVYGDLVPAVAGMEVGADDKEGKKRQTRGGKTAKVVKKKEKRIVLSREQRNKKKYVTIVTGMGSCDIDPKKAAKIFANKYSCGSSVTGDDEIVIQGDVADDLIDFITEKWPEIEEDCIEDKT